MDESPYDPPQQEIPAWRRIASLPLLILGGLGLADGLIEMATRHGSSIFVALICAGVFAVGVWLRWGKLA